MSSNVTDTPGDLAIQLLAKHYDAAGIADAIEQDPRLAAIDCGLLREVMATAKNLSAAELAGRLVDVDEVTRSIALFWWVFVHCRSQALTEIHPYLEGLLPENTCERSLVELSEILYLRDLSPPRKLEQMWQGLERLLESPDSIKKDLMIAKYRLSMARQYRYLGDLECAIEGLDVSAALCKKHGFMDYLQVQMLRGTLLYEVGDVYSALNIHEDPDLEEFCQAMKGGRMELGFLVCAAKCRIDLGDLDLAQERLRKAFAVVRERCDDSADVRTLRSDAHRFHAELLWRRGAHQKALESLRVAEGIAEEIEDSLLRMAARTVRMLLFKSSDDDQACLSSLVDLLQLGCDMNYFSRESRTAILEVCEAYGGSDPVVEDDKLRSRAQSPWVFTAALEAVAKKLPTEHAQVACELGRFSVAAGPALEKSCRERLYADQLIDRSFS